MLYWSVSNNAVRSVYAWCFVIGRFWRTSRYLCLFYIVYRGAPGSLLLVLRLPDLLPKLWIRCVRGFRDVSAAMGGGHTVLAHGGQQHGQGPRPCSTEGARGEDRQTDGYTDTHDPSMICWLLLFAEKNTGYTFNTIFGYSYYIYYENRTRSTRNKKVQKGAKC